MSDLLLSPMGFWTAFTIIVIFVLMAWFIYKLTKLSAPKQPETKD